MEADKPEDAEQESERPFFDISSETSSPQEHPPPTTIIGATAPGPVQVGDLGSPVSGTTSTPQLSGEVASLDGMFQLQPTLDEPKKPFRWGQFFLGLFVPYIVFFLLTIAAEVSNQGGEDIPDFYRYEEVSLVPDDEGWYNSTVVKAPEESVDFRFDLDFSGSDYRGVSMNFWVDVVDWEGNGLVLKTGYDGPDGDYSETEIGEFTPSNQTIWFKLNGSDVKTYNTTIVFHDFAAEQAWWDDHSGPAEIFSMILCGMPVVYVGSTIAAFGRGNRALGIGLLSAIPAGIILLPAMAITLLILFGL